MAKLLAFINLGWYVLLVSLVIPYAECKSYKAAVVEYSPSLKTVSMVDCIQKNLEGYELALKMIKDDEVQIAVFPEDGLLCGASFNDLKVYFENVPDVLNGAVVNPCLQNEYQDQTILRALSCMARDNNLVIVANMGDRKPCNRSVDINCPFWGENFYNTDVVFESDGKLIAKYHKIHLYSDEKVVFTPGNHTSGTSFTTKFGVTFGVFTCYDILFTDPAECLLDSNIKNFIFPTAWGNEFPFYMSIVVQQGWSHRNNVNLLAANRYNLNFFGTGSGIYSGGVALTYHLSGDELGSASGKVLISNVPADPNDLVNKEQNGDVTNAAAIKAKLVPSATFQILNRNQTTVTVSAEYEEKVLTCSLEYNIVINDSDIFALGVTLDKESGDFVYGACFVTKCDSLSTCGHVTVKSNTVFDKLKLSGNFPPGSKIYPSAFSTDFNLLKPDDIQYTTNTLSIAHPNKIVSVGLWAMIQSTEFICPDN